MNDPTPTAPSEVSEVSEDPTHASTPPSAADRPDGASWPELAAHGIRPPRPAESLSEYLLVVMRATGVIRADAKITDAKRAELVTEALERAESDEHHGSSRIGKALLTARLAHAQANPELVTEGLGEVGANSIRAGKPSGIPMIVAALLREIAGDPSKARRLSAPERMLLAVYAPDVSASVKKLQRTIERRLGDVTDAVSSELTKLIYGPRPTKTPDPPRPIEPVPTRTNISGLERVPQNVAKLVHGKLAESTFDPPTAA